MKSLLASWLLTGGLILGFAAIATAQDTGSAQSNDYNTATDNTYNSGAPNAYAPSPTTGNSASAAAATNMRTLSGCLREGAGANEYSLHGYNASSWEVISNNVDLSAHIGQEVQVTYISRASNGTNGGSRALVVTDVHMLSSACSW